MNKPTPHDMLRHAMADAMHCSSQLRPSRRHRRPPGEIIARMSAEKRQLLKQLKSEDIVVLDRDAIWDDQATEDAKNFSRLKQNFDAKFFKTTRR